MSRLPGGSPRILLLSLVFAPDGVSTAILMTELTQELRRLGHDVTVLTTTPHYNEDAEAHTLQSLRPRFGGLVRESRIDGIRVWHARFPAKGKRILSRLLEYGWFHAASTALGATIARDYDIVIAPSPPLTIGLNAWFLARIRGVPFVYNVQEIYPDVAVEVGVLRNRRLVRLAERLERFIYERADRIVVISDQFRRRLRQKGVPAERLTVIPNFVDADFVTPGPQSNPFSRAHGLQDRFVVLYAGNLGLTQDLESLLDAAQILVDTPEIHFLVVGGGSRKDWLNRRLERDRPANVTLLEYQPRSSVPDLYAAAGVSVIPMKPGMTRDTFPSKVYTIMASGRPVIAATEPDSELASVIRAAGAGDVTTPGDAGALATAIRAAFHDRAESRARGERARRYVERYHTRSAAARKYDELIRELTNTRARAAHRQAE